MRPATRKSTSDGSAHPRSRTRDASSTVTTTFPTSRTHASAVRSTTSSQTAAGGRTWILTSFTYGNASSRFAIAPRSISQTFACGSIAARPTTVLRRSCVSPETASDCIRKNGADASAQPPYPKTASARSNGIQYVRARPASVRRLRRLRGFALTRPAVPSGRRRNARSPPPRRRARRRRPRRPLPP